MTIARWMTACLLASAAVACGQHSAAKNQDGAEVTPWVGADQEGRLVYQQTERGDQIMDFSFAGYRGGGVALPAPAVKVTVMPSGGDDTARIQAAVDEVGKMPMEGGMRGAVLLGPGVFTCGRTIALETSGVVLRGSGSGQGGTTIRMVGPKHRAVTIGGERGGRAGRAAGAATATRVADAYVPEGARTFTVLNAGAFAVGDRVEIRRPTTAAWIHQMNMDTLRRDGKKETWIGVGRDEIMQRRITAIAGNRLTVDVPLADSLDARVLAPPGTIVAKASADEARVTDVGVEDLHIQCPPLETAYTDAPYAAVRVDGDDCWVKDLYCQETMNTIVMAGRRITIEGVNVTHTYPNLGASKPSDFSIEGSQILVDRCKVTGDNEYFVWTSSLCPGPNVVLGSTFRGRGSRIQPHQRWSTALLVDNCTVPDGGIDFSNRGVAGSGHGWTMGWGVAWNCVAKTYIIQQPPGAMNWEIGCIGQREREPRYFDTAPVLPEGTVISPGKPVAPASLYLAQLRERLGESGLKNIGYSENTPAAFPDKDTPRLPEWKGKVDPQLGLDLAFHRPLQTSGMRTGVTDPRQFSGEKAVDSDESTYWATQTGGNAITLELDMEGPVDINALALSEVHGFEGRVQHYKVEGQVNSDWQLLSEGTTIGNRKVDHFPKATVWKVRLTLSSPREYPAIRTFNLYCTK